jgi:hypothetical protein
MQVGCFVWGINVSPGHGMDQLTEAMIWLLGLSEDSHFFSWLVLYLIDVGLLMQQRLQTFFCVC